MIDRKNPILCYVTDRRSLSVASATPASTSASTVPGRVASGTDFVVESARLVEKITALAAAGIDWVQIREKDLPARDLAALTREATARTRAASSDQPARIIVNDRLDVALAEGAGGVHLGEAGLPVADVARWLKRAGTEAATNGRVGASQFAVGQFSRGPGGNFLIGASCHSLEKAKNAVRDGADYVFFGPVFATPSKAKFGEPQGLKKLAAVCDAISVPVIAIGGISLQNAGQCMSAGAAGIAAIRLLQDAAEPGAVVARLKKLG